MNSDLLLAIESAVGGGSLSLFAGRSEIAAWKGSDGMSRAEDLLPQIDRLLKQNGLTSKALTSVAVSVGPGSFTGIRIGLATAIGLCKAVNAQLFSVSILRVLASRSDSPDILAAVPLGRGSIGIQEFSRTDEKLIELSSPRSVDLQDFVEWVSINKDHGLVLPTVLVQLAARNRNVVDVGDELASVLGRYCCSRKPETVSPLFISKK